MKQGIGIIGRTRKRQFCGAGMPGFSAWLAARWDVAPRRGKARAPAVFRKTPGPGRSVERHVHLGAESGPAALHLGLRMEWRLRFAQFIQQRAGGAGLVRVPRAAAPAAPVSMFVLPGARVDRLRTLETRVREMGGAAARGAVANVPVRREFAPGARVTPAGAGAPGEIRHTESRSMSRIERPVRENWVWTRLVNRYATPPGTNRLTVIAGATAPGRAAQAPSMTSLSIRDERVSHLARTVLARTETSAWLRLSLARGRDPVEAARTAAERTSRPTMTPAGSSVRAASGPSDYRRAVAAPLTLAHARPAASAPPDVSQALAHIQQTLEGLKAREAAQPALDIPQLTRQVYSQLERELRIEKERRGL